MNEMTPLSSKHKRLVRSTIKTLQNRYAWAKDPKRIEITSIDVGKTYEVKSLLRRGGLFNILIGTKKRKDNAHHSVVIKVGHRELINLSQFRGWHKNYPFEYFISEGTIMDYLSETGYSQAPKLYHWGIGTGLPLELQSNSKIEVKNRPIFIYEYIDGVDIDDYYHEKKNKGDTLPRHDVLSIASEVFSALAGLHQRGVLHRDMRMPNIMLQHNGGIKLIDFNISRFLAWDKHRYPDIEQVKNVEYFEMPKAYELDYSADIYEAGIWLYTIYNGIYPYAELEPVAMPHGKASRSVFGYRNDECGWLSTIENRLLTLGFTIPLGMKEWHSKKSRKANKDDHFELLLLDMLNPDPRRRPSANECLAKISEI